MLKTERLIGAVRLVFWEAKWPISVAMAKEPKNPPHTSGFFRTLNLKGAAAKSKNPSLGIRLKE